MDSSSKPSFALFSSPYHPSAIVSVCCCSRIAQRGFAGAASHERSPTSDPSKKAKGKHSWNKELGKIEDHLSLFWTTQELSQKNPLQDLGFILSEFCCCCSYTTVAVKSTPMLRRACFRPRHPQPHQEMSHIQSPTRATGHNIDALEIHVRVPPSHQRGVIGENCRQINREGEN